MGARNRQRPENMDKQAVIATLNKILEMELAGVVRYTHYSLMVYGPYRMPIVDWLRAQATESLLHAQQAGEMITQLGEHPSLAIGPLLETHDHDIEAILKESLEHERTTLGFYNELRQQVELQPGQLQDLIEHEPEVLTAPLDELHVLALGGGDGGGFEDLHQPHHPAERGSNLVTHGCEELRLDLVCRLRRELSLALGGDVRVRPGEADGLPLGVSLDHAPSVEDVDPVPVPVPHAVNVLVEGGLSCEVGLDGLVAGLEVVGVDP